MEIVKYEKRFAGEYRDSMIPQVISYLNVEYLLEGMTFVNFISFQSYFCYVFIIVYFLLFAMILTRDPATINLSS